MQPHYPEERTGVKNLTVNWPSDSKQARIATLQGSADALPVSVAKSTVGTHESFKLGEDNTV